MRARESDIRLWNFGIRKTIDRSLFSLPLPHLSLLFKEREGAKAFYLTLIKGRFKADFSRIGGLFYEGKLSRN